MGPFGDSAYTYVPFSSGMSDMQKNLNVLLIILPKVLLSVGLLIAGCGLIVQSADEETVVLNTLASNFVLETDELLYKISCSSYVQKRVSELPPMQKKPAMWSAALSFVGGNLALGPVILAIVLFANSFCSMDGSE